MTELTVRDFVWYARGREKPDALSHRWGENLPSTRFSSFLSQYLPRSVSVAETDAAPAKAGHHDSGLVD